MREEKNNKSSHKVRKVIHLTKKRWLYPALYVSLAAVLVASVLLYQMFIGDNTATNNHVNKNNVTTNQGEPSVPASKGVEVVKKPVGDGVDEQKKFYDDSASSTDQEQSLVQSGTTYTTNTGVDYAAKDGQPFDVVAALSGTVVKAEKDALLGYVVQIQHNDKVVTFYQSLDSIKVEEGMTVKQGDVLGKAGRSLFNKDAGVHVHFEIRNDGVAVNPDAFLGKTLNDVSKKVEQPAQSSTDSSSNNSANTNSDDSSNTTKPSTEQPANPGSDNGADMNSGDNSDNTKPSTEKPQSSTDVNGDDVLTDTQTQLNSQFYNSQQ